MKSLFLTAACLVFGFALDASAQNSATIEIPVQMSAAKAADMIQLAALRGGWTVASTSDKMVSLDVYKPKGNEGLNVELRANIINSDSTAIVVLSGLWSNDLLAYMQGNKAAMGKATQPITGPPFKRLNRAGKLTWAELEKFANAVKKAIEPSP